MGEKIVKRIRGMSWTAKISLMLVFTVFLSIFLFAPDEAQAVVITSTATGGTWATGTTWVGGVAPVAGDDAIIAAGATVTLGAVASITNITINSTGTLAGSTFLLTVTGNYTNNGTHSGTGGATLSGAGNIDGTGSITNTGTFTISGNKIIANTANLTFAGTIAISGGLTVTNNGIITSTAAGGITGVIAGSTWLNAANSTLKVTGPLLATGTLTATAVPNTVNYLGAAAQTVKGTTYVNLTLSGSGAKTTTGVTVSGILSIEGTATASAAVTWSGTAYTLQYKTTNVRTVGAEWTTPFAGTGGVIIANTAGSITLNDAKVFNNSVPLTINSGATLITNNLALTLGGNFVNNGGTFTAGTSTVLFNGTGNQSISGDNTWYNLQITTPGGVARTVKFASGATQTISNTLGALTLTGASATQLLTLAPSGATAWLLNKDAAITPSISDVSVSFSNASGGQIDASNGTNSNAGNNTNWKFTATIVSCVGCHGYKATFPDGTARNTPDGAFLGSHNKHVVTYSYSNVCSVCHVAPLTETSADFKHRNGTITMASPINGETGAAYTKGSSWAQTNSPSAFTACTNTYCHSKGQSPFAAPLTDINWSGTSNCTSTCHGGNDTYDNVNTNGPAGQHKKHIGAIAYPTGGYNYTCDECHAETVTANTSTKINATTGYDKHVNTVKDWKFSDNISYPDGTPSRDSGFSQATGSYASSQCTNLYCHSKGTMRTADPATYPYTGAGVVPYQTPSWTGTLTSCNGCHGDASNTDGRPAYANYGPKNNSHQTASHKAKGCQECHWATTQNGTSIVDRTKHVNFEYNVSNSVATLSYTAGALDGSGFPYGGTCTALPTTGCHGAAQWGVTEINCLTCHNSLTDNGDGAPTRRAVTSSTGGGEFVSTWSHKRTASSSATYPTVAGQASKYDCCVCHREGDAATGAVNSTYHKNNLIDLRNPDDGLGTGLTPYAAEKLPSSASDASGKWTTPTNVYASDDARAVYTNTTQNDLCVTGFSFAITAVPTNITVIIEGNGTDATATNRQIRVGLTKTGCTLAGTRKTAVQLNQTTDTKILSGGGIDKWGTTWTTAEVNAGTFGVLISDNDATAAALNIDSVKVVIDAFTAFSRDTASATLEPWVTNVQNNLCLKCHDAGGATSAQVPGGSALRPFGTAPSHTTGSNVLDVDAHFTTTYASFHPIKGVQNNSYCNNNTMVAPWNALSPDKTPGTPSNGYLISCWDCHNALKTAHGGDLTLRAAYSRPADAPTPLCSLCHKDSVYAADLKGTGDTYSAFGAGGHALDTAPADGKRDDGLDAAADSHIGSRHSGAINDYGCQHCHSSKVSADPSRPIRAEEAHGFNTFTDAATTWPSGGQKPYAFIRNKETFRGIEVRKVDVTTYTPGCTHSNVDDADSVCEAKHNDSVKYIYGPGGAY